MKKLICVLMIVALMAAFMAVSAFAAENPQIVVESATAKAGEEVVLTVSLVNNPGISNGKITVDFDNTGLEFVEIDTTPATAAGFTVAMTNPAQFNMNFLTVADNVTGDFVLFTVKFRVLEDAEGEFEVNLTINKLVDGNNETVEFEVVKGVVTVAHECTLEEVAGVEATCTEDGVRAHEKCASCGKLFIDGEEVTEEDLVIPALGHTADEAVKENVVEATCTTAGSYEEVVYCAVCGEEMSRETVEVPAAHTPAEAVKENEVAATCTTDGSYDLVVYCSVCGEVLSRETVVVPAAHNYVDGVCTECGEKDPNPETGDFVYVAVATALVSMMGVVALTKKKEY